MNEAAADTLERDGWVVLPDVLSPEEVTRYRTLLEPILEANGLGRTTFEGRSTERVYALLAKCPEIAALAEHPAILELADPLMERGYLLSSVQAVRIHEGESASACRDRETLVRGSSGIWRDRSSERML